MKKVEHVDVVSGTIVWDKQLKCAGVICSGRIERTVGRTLCNTACFVIWNDAPDTIVVEDYTKLYLTEVALTKLSNSDIIEQTIQEHLEGERTCGG